LFRRLKGDKNISSLYNTKAVYCHKAISHVQISLNSFWLWAEHFGYHQLLGFFGGFFFFGGGGIFGFPFG